jgi:TonB family protein
MNADLLLAALGSPVADALGWTLVHSLWQCLLLGLFYMLVERMTDAGSAALRYGLGMTVLGSMLVCMAVTFVLVYEAATGVAAGTSAPLVAVGPGQGPHATTIRSVVEPLVPWGALLWLVGVVLRGARLIGDMRRLGRITAGARPLPQPWPAVVDRLRRQLGIGRVVRVLESVRVGVPIVAGWLRPVIIVPPSALMGLTPRQLELIIGHELAHVARLDYLFNFGQLVVETLLFFHPAVHYVSRRVRQERENCCDDAVVARTGETLAYARALAEIEGLRCSRGPRPAAAATGGQVSARISRLITLRANGGGAAGWLAAMTVLAFIAGAVPGGARLAADYANAIDTLPLTRPPAVVSVGTSPSSVPNRTAPRPSADAQTPKPSPAIPTADNNAPKPSPAIPTADSNAAKPSPVIPAADGRAPNRPSASHSTSSSGPTTVTASGGAARGMATSGEAGRTQASESPGHAANAMPAPGATAPDPAPSAGIGPPARAATPAASSASVASPPTELAIAAAPVPGASAGDDALAPPSPTSPVEDEATAADIVAGLSEAGAPPGPSTSAEDAARSPGLAGEDGTGPNGVVSALSQSGAPSAASPSAGDTAPPAPVTTGGTLLRSPPPSYPRRARTRGIEGEVTVRYDVDQRGRVENVSILSSAPGRTFEDAVRRAVRKWRHEPFLVDGRPVAASITRTFEFAIRGEELTADASDADHCRRVTGSRLCRSHNAYAELGVVVVLNPR